MEKNKNLFITLGFLLLFFGCMKYGGQTLWPTQSFNEKENTPNIKNTENIEFPAFVKLPTDRKEVVLLQTYKKPKEIQNLILMTHVLFEYTNDKRTMDDLLIYLKTSGQEPEKFETHHASLGSSYTIRTKAPLQGTRYFHGQYETDKQGKPFVQHISFEFQPGPNSMNEAENALKLAYSGLGAPYINDENLKAWKLPDGLHAYIKKLDIDDITDHPFNSYKKTDVGVIQLAIEIDVHGSDDGHGH